MIKYSGSHTCFIGFYRTNVHQENNMNRKLLTAGLLIAATTFTTSALALDYSKLPKKKQTTLGLYVSPTNAHAMIEGENGKLLFIDVRTRAEVNFLGMPTEADANIPYMKLSEWYGWDAKKNNFKMELNDEFLPALRARLAEKGLSKDDRVILMCRSGSRSAAAANLLAKDGFTNVYTIVEGYEGDKAKHGEHKGQRVVNGWKNTDLPWTYKLAQSKMFIPGE